MDGKELYRWLQGRECQFSMRDMGCSMWVYKSVIDGYWRTRYLVNTLTLTAHEIVGCDLLLKSFTYDDIDMESVCRCEHVANAYRLAAYYPFDIYPYRNGVAYVCWTLYPDGMYFRDEDGYGMEPCVEESVGAYIDTNCEVLVKFQNVQDRYTRERLYEEALMKVKK